MNGEPGEGLHAETLETNPDQILLTPLPHHAAPSSRRFPSEELQRTLKARAASGERRAEITCYTSTIQTWISSSNEKNLRNVLKKYSFRKPEVGGDLNKVGGRPPCIRRPNSPQQRLPPSNRRLPLMESILGTFLDIPASPSSFTCRVRRPPTESSCPPPLQRAPLVHQLPPAR